MLNNHLPHRVALRAMLIALGLPIVLFMFLGIRTRQLQSTSNPRWAQFAKVTGPIASADPEPAAANRLPVLAVSVEPAQLPREVEIKQDSIESNQTAALIDPLKGELDQIRQQLDRLVLLEKDHQSEDARIESQLANLLNTIRDLVSGLSTASPAPENEAPIVETISKKEFLDTAEKSATWDQFLTESAQEVDLQQFLTKFGELAQIKILSQVEPQNKPEKPQLEPAPEPKPEPVPIPLPRPLQVVQQEKSSSDPKYFLYREGNVILICTAEESIHLKPGSMNRIQRANLRNDIKESDLNLLLPLIVNGLVNDSDKPARDELATGSAARSGRLSISRKALACSYYECAVASRQNGDVSKARQQINTSLRLYKDDIKAIRLKNEINQISTQNANRELPENHDNPPGRI